MKHLTLLILLMVYACSSKQDSFQTEALNDIIISKTKEVDSRLSQIHKVVIDNGNQPLDSAIYHESFTFYRTIMIKLSADSLHESSVLVKSYLFNKKINALSLVNRINHFDSIMSNNENITDSQFLKISILDGLNELMENNIQSFGTDCKMLPDHAFIIYKQKKYSIGDTAKICIVPGETCTNDIYIFKPINIELTNTNSGQNENFEIEYAGNAAFVKFTATERGTFRLKGSLKYCFRYHGAYYVENSFNELIQFVD